MLILMKLKPLKMDLVCRGVVRYSDSFCLAIGFNIFAFELCDNEISKLLLFELFKDTFHACACDGRISEYFASV